MKRTDPRDKIKQDDKVCYNCKNMIWLVGIGQGVRCGKKNPPLNYIPSLSHTCEHFEFLKNNKNEK